MSTTRAPAPVLTGRAEQNSTRLAFFIAGFAIAAWAPLVPFAKQRVGLSDGALGLLLLCLGAGSLVAMPLTGAAAARHGCRRVIVAATVVLCIALPVLAWVSALPVLAAALLVFGAAVGTVDCAVNIQAVIVERDSGRPMMSGFHGLYSVGGIAGAAGMTVALGAGATPLVATLGVVIGIAVALAVAAPSLLATGAEASGPAFAVPHGAVLLIGALCFVVFLTEGAALDWSAVFLTTVRGLEPSRAGLAYAAFSATMTLGRLTGDVVVARLGRTNVIAWGSLSAAAGLAVATLVPAWEAAILGYALVGAGCSNIVPVLYTAAGRQTAMPEHLAVPAITTIGYAGILAGPATIGVLAHYAGLSVALLAVAVLLLGVAAGGRTLRV